MDVKRKMEMVVRQGTFAELEEEDITYCASLTTSESIDIMEQMRKMIWSKEYLLPMVMEGKIRNLKDDYDEFE